MDKDISFFSDENKLKHFHDTALKSANEQAQMIEQEILQYKNSYLQKKQKRISNEVEAYKLNSISIAQKEAAKSVSDYGMKCKVELLQLKKDAQAEIFEQVKSKLCNFHNNEKYFDFLCRLYDNCSKQCKGDIEITLGSCDKQYEQKLKDYISSNYKDIKFEISFDDSIVFGGMRVMDLHSRLLINETIDERLTNETESFSI